MLNNLLLQDVRCGKIIEVLQAVILNPKDVETSLVPRDKLCIAEFPEALRLASFMPVLRVVAGNKVLQIIQLQSPSFFSVKCMFVRRS